MAVPTDETTPSLPTDRTAGTPATDVVLRWVTTLAGASIPMAFLFGALAGMAADVHPETVAVVRVCWFGSWTVTPLLVAAFWLCRRRPALAGAGRLAGWVAPVPPTVTILLAHGL
ncbi:hypothetical protein ACFYZT_29845 [Streptomyces sp. NPDC001591]|uniref:hypothetical protein n=1 Tax=Streptomyces sp. NPDC001591 TaxID=3364589 RepID=UPI003693C8C1